MKITTIPGKNNKFFYREEEFNYDKFLDAFIIKLENTKEKIVGILFFGARTKSEDGKYNGQCKRSDSSSRRDIEYGN